MVCIWDISQACYKKKSPGIRGWMPGLLQKGWFHFLLVTAFFSSEPAEIRTP